MTPTRDHDICIVGGAGHVGLPLALVFAGAGQRVVVFDTNTTAMEAIEGGAMPFIEYGAEPLLASALAERRLTFSSDAGDIARARHVIVAVGTPVDEYLNPKLRALLDLFTRIRVHLDPEQTIIIRSTVFPRTCRHVLRLLAGDGRNWHVAYCPERIAQGYAIRELNELPQIVSGCSEEAVDRATKLFALIAPQTIRLEVEEAELAKLFTNAWRYIQFAAANQFYMIAASGGVDFNTVRQAMVDGYGRAASLPSAGFAAGPCLLKDTMQLAAFNANGFSLGHAAMGINEGLPSFLVESLKRQSQARRDHRRHSRHGVQGRHRRHPRLALVQARQGATLLRLHGPLLRRVREGSDLYHEGTARRTERRCRRRCASLRLSHAGRSRAPGDR